MVRTGESLYRFVVIRLLFAQPDGGCGPVAAGLPVRGESKGLKSDVAAR